MMKFIAPLALAMMIAPLTSPGAFEFNLFGEDRADPRAFGVEAEGKYRWLNAFSGKQRTSVREVRFACDLTIATECSPDPLKTQSTWRLTIRRDAEPDSEAEPVYTVHSHYARKTVLVGAWPWAALVEGVTQHLDPANDGYVTIQLRAIPEGE